LRLVAPRIAVALHVGEHRHIRVNDPHLPADYNTLYSCCPAYRNRLSIVCSAMGRSGPTCSTCHWPCSSRTA